MLNPVLLEPTPLRSAVCENSIRLLFVGSDAGHLSAFRQFVRGREIEVIAVADAEAAMSLAANRPHDAVVLDMAVRQHEGLEFLRLLRSRCDAPVIVVTAAAAQRRVAALEAGADDCVSVPLDLEELTARIRALLRRQGMAARRRRSIQIRSVRLDPGSRDVWVRGRPVVLTSAEFTLLETLMAGAGRVVTRERLIWALRQRESMGVDRALDVHVARLRRKIGRPSPIRTVRGEGYFFCCEPAG